MMIDSGRYEFGDILGLFSSLALRNFIDGQGNLPDAQYAP